MTEITMDTDWGARGAQLTGAQVQSFIKGQLKALQAKDKELKKLIDQIVINGGSTEDYNAQMKAIREQIAELQKLLDEYGRSQSDWLLTDNSSRRYIKNKPEIKTVKEVPSESLKTYKNIDGSNVSYAIGDMVRYQNPDKEYYFYRVNDILPNGDVMWEKCNSSAESLYEKVIISLSTNQTDDLDLIGKKVTILELNTLDESNNLSASEYTWNGIPIVHKALINRDYKIIVENVQNYKSPSVQDFYTPVGGNVRKLDFVYKCEVLTVTLATDNGTSCALDTVTVTDTHTHIAIGTVAGESATFKIPFGVNYKITVSDKVGFVSPDEKRFLANQVNRAVTLTYRYHPIKKECFIFDNTVNDPATKITHLGDIKGLLDWIRKNTHRVLARNKYSGVCKVIKLLDTDTTKYFDGTSAPIANLAYDVMLMLPDFWYYGESIGSNKWKIWIADKNPKDGKPWNQWHHNNLIGVYEGYVTGNKLYSVSGQIPTDNYSLAEFVNYAELKGDGYELVNWQAHCVIAMLTYAYYSDIRIATKCGMGGDTDYQKPTGASNQIGMTDTKTTDYRDYVNIWGLENWYGCVNEYVGNISVENNNWTIVEGSQQRIIENVNSETGWITNILLGEKVDMIPTQTGKTYSSSFGCEFLNNTAEQHRAVSRGGVSVSQSNGMITVNASAGLNKGKLGFGTRLMFTGTIEEASSVVEFLS